MPKLIKNKALINNPWHIVENEEQLTAHIENSTSKDAALLVSTELWESAKDVLAPYMAKGELGLFINNDQSYLDMPENFSKAAVIAINFPVFTDGRAYTIARDLREKLNYTGEVRAVGDVLHDQLNAMLRCGFDAFELVDDKDEVKAMLAFDDFSSKYQADLLESKPVYQR